VDTLVVADFPADFPAVADFPVVAAQVQIKEQLVIHVLGNDFVHLVTAPGEMNI
jgi:hypothetical protein